MANDAYQLQGLNGGKVLGDTSTTFNSATDSDGKFGRGFLAVTDTVLDGYTGNLVNGADLVGVTIVAGMFIPGSVDTLSVASGFAIVPF